MLKYKNSDAYHLAKTFHEDPGCWRDKVAYSVTKVDPEVARKYIEVMRGAQGLVFPPAINSIEMTDLKALRKLIAKLKKKQGAVCVKTKNCVTGQ